MTEILKLRLSFVVGLAGVLGSLYFSELLKLPPCSMCWYQRIALYPLVLIFGVALWSDDRGHRKYSMPLIAIGLVLSLYHNLLYYGVIPDELIPCSQGVSCTTKQLELFGFVTIPLLALASFASLLLLNLNFKSGESK